MIRRENDAKRVAKSVRTHQLTMEAFGRAAMSSDQVNLARWLKPQGIRKTGSMTSKIDSQNSKGLITSGEADSEKVELALSGREGKFHSGVLKDPKSKDNK